MTIRIETGGSSDLTRTMSWLARHRGEVVRLDDNRRVVFGNPISGARAVIVAVTLEDSARPGLHLRGVVRALSNRTEFEPVKLVFEGRSPASLPEDEAAAIATEVLERISGLVVDDEPMAEVA